MKLLYLVVKLRQEKSSDVYTSISNPKGLERPSLMIRIEKQDQIEMLKEPEPKEALSELLV